MNTQIKGQNAEALACTYLQNQGLKLLARNYQCRFGEIDIIARDAMFLVFVEVRARISDAFGGALSSVTRSKQQKIVKTAYHYLMAHKLNDKYPLRFDVVALQGKCQEVHWIKQAFDLDY